MYADRSTAGGCVAAGTCLAVTGYDVTQMIFLVITAAVLLITGFTLMQLVRAKPSQITTGPPAPKGRRR